MRALRENVVPVAFLALWVAASGYTLHRLAGLPAPSVVHATIDLTVTPHGGAASHAACTAIPVLRSDADI
ncbi:MAG: hypothetical protein ACJ79H_08540 [Myxococcales bacterium]